MNKWHKIKHEQIIRWKLAINIHSHKNSPFNSLGDIPPCDKIAHSSNISFGIILPKRLYSLFTSWNKCTGVLDFEIWLKIFLSYAPVKLPMNAKKKWLLFKKFLCKSTQLINKYMHCKKISTAITMKISKQMYWTSYKKVTWWNKTINN